MIEIDQVMLKEEIDKAVADFQQFNIDLEDKLARAITDGCLMVEADAKRNLVEGRHVVTGRLLNSITHSVERDTKGKVVGYVGSKVKYAPWLEYGTRRMRPYPYLLPALAANKDRIQRAIKKAVEEAEGEI